ncbi:MAG: phosphoribosylformylglycinamidine synthase subunit PurQ [Thermoanaerobacteraceae bacterium]|nr:phosphoribosylformylglycinamidine synthase subunit PurQ [Thermoanaerobacteraceae bacterium]
MKCAVIQFAGTSGDSDCYHVCKNLLNKPVEYVFHKESFAPEDFDLIILPGGASHGDYLRPGALAARSKVMKSVIDAAKAKKLILGIGNGFQILLEAGLLQGAVLLNKDLKFHCDDVFVRVENTDTPFTCLYKKGEIIRLTLACKYGNYFADSETIKGLKANERIVFTYCDKNGNKVSSSNLTGSLENIAGIVNPEGNILGLMPHPDRCVEELLGNTDGLRIFESIVQYIEGGRANG